MNGPIVTEFKCDENFQVYKKGIMIDKRGEQHSKSEFKTLAQMESKMAQESLDHTIFLIGWGHDDKTNTPYWIVRNSYGTKWGEFGDFRVRRGHNDFGIESELSKFDVTLI